MSVSAKTNPVGLAVNQLARSHKSSEHDAFGADLSAQYGAIAEGISLLLAPHAEVAIHDLRTSKIAYLANAFSKRKVGDDSLIDGDLNHICSVPVYGPYEKAHVNGDMLKSVTTVLRDGSGTPVGLLCVNINLSVFDRARAALDSILSFGPASFQAEPLVSRDWRESANFEIQEFLRQRSKTLPALTKDERGELIFSLADRGFFEIRGASERLASQLNMSRATLYRFLASIPKKR